MGSQTFAYPTFAHRLPPIDFCLFDICLSTQKPITAEKWKKTKAYQDICQPDEHLSEADVCLSMFAYQTFAYQTFAYP